mmetsp:Transcript_107025/g.333600  ORF Transcript_107025/g.333600 Transcript_107025/m.333600 type:complete len:414 (-) Transcript_107025:199-1440(-)
MVHQAEERPGACGLQDRSYGARVDTDRWHEPGPRPAARARSPQQGLGGAAELGQLVQPPRLSRLGPGLRRGLHLRRGRQPLARVLEAPRVLRVEGRPPGGGLQAGRGHLLEGDRARRPRPEAPGARDVEVPPGLAGHRAGVGAAHSDFAWAVRVHPRMKHIFAQIYGTEDLVVGMDSVKLDDCEARGPGPPWLHRDQLRDVDAYSIQTIFTFYEVGPENAGTILVQDSHFEEYPWDDAQDGVSLLREDGRQRNSVKVPKGQQQAFMARAIKPRVPDNGLVLFNSRTIHASAPSSVVRWKHEAQHRWPRPALPRPNRVGVSVAMCPRSRRSEACRSRKMRVYTNQGSTAHWPDDELHWPDEWTGADGHDMNEVWDRWGSQSKDNTKDKWSERPDSRFRHLPRPDIRIRDRISLL